jgi:hypothetical protein
MKVTGVLSISNGSGLQYPYPVVVHSLMRMCDDVIVGVDPEFPLDRKTLESFDLENDGLQIVDAPWDRTNRNGGTEIAVQMDKLVDIAQEQGSGWVVVMQADELLHDDDFPMFKAFMQRYLDTPTNGFSMERIYFWKDLDTVREDWKADLVRVFKPGTYSFMAEGTDKSGMFSAAVKPGEEIKLPYKIYHYSRVDSPMVISKRVRNLDALFHPDEALIAVDDLPAYDFVTREYDNFAKAGLPTEVSGEVKPYKDTHPIGVREWYGDERA